MSKESCLILAGERSGEDHALTFFDELKSQRPSCDFYGVGGDRLEEKGVELFYNLREFSGIGISEVLGKIPFYYKAMAQILKEVDRRETKVAILVDFQTFNLKLAKKLKKRGVEVLYYVAPQAWVWKAYRAKILERTVHTLFTILPFEKQWFMDRGVSKAKGVMHPLMIEHGSRIQSVRPKHSSNFKNRKARVLLLPGSRRSEVGVLLPIFLRGIELVKENHQIEIGIVEVDSVSKDLYQNDQAFAKVWSAEELPDAFDWADMCVAASGTVTLAAGLFGVPTVVCYKLSLLTEFIASFVLKYEGPVSLANIAHQKRLFPELIQHQADRYNINKHLRNWLENEQSYDQVAQELGNTKTLLTGEDFSVSEYMAQVIQSAYES